MSYHTPAGWADRCAFVGDNEGPHQIRLTAPQHIHGVAKRIYVGCACGDLNQPITTAEEALDIWRRHEQAAEITEALVTEIRLAEPVL